MIIVHFYDDKAEVTTFDEAGQHNFKNCEDRNDWKTFERVEEVAALLTKSTGKLYIPVTKDGSPAFDVIAAPCVGDKVSYAFNGDYTPCGEIATISKTMRRITTTEGTQFYRTSPTSACWKAYGHSSMVGGHIDERNPHV
jgi:hypothetical protein